MSIYLDELVKEITGTLSPAPQVTIRVKLTDHKVTIDKDMLRYILSNLISNALKFTTSTANIGVTVTEVPDHNIMFRIADDGIGIPKQDISAIFEPFHRGQNVLHFPGTGLGLSIVKRCVDLHKGSVEIESKLGEGTVVTVILPRNLN
jgi:signal transduction histidine kinase